MKEAFISHLKTIDSTPDSFRYLLAVSGGMDSMLMLHLFQQSGLNFSVANINFKLRGKEAEDDSLLVKETCHKNNIPFFHKSFNTIEYANKNGVSIQMAARELRYQWFNELANNHNFHRIAIAHHLDDQTETFLINLVRGTGIAGMHGISTKQNRIIRPLMFTNRATIDNYIRKNKIDYREDSSNASDKYQRNYIRHHILPHLYHLRNDFSESLNQSIGFLSEIESYALEHLNNEIDSLILHQPDGLFKIEIQPIIKHSHQKLLLYHVFKDFGFQNCHIEDLIKLIVNKEVGKRIESAEYQILVDRDSVLLEVRKTETESARKIELKDLEDANWKNQNLELEFPYQGSYKSNHSNIAFLDLQKLNFPLYIRNWKAGDYFQPLGMKGKKKLSDFLIDQKVPLTQKQRVRILCNQEEIIWIIGHRIDQRFAIDEQTEQILKITYHGDY